jgi:replication factor A2
MSQYDYSGRGGHSGYILNEKKTPSSPGGSPRKKVRNHSVLPVTVKQLLEAQQVAPEADEFLIDNREIHEVYIVGMIARKEELSTSLNYLIDDGTGQINVRIWLPKDVASNYLHLVSPDWIEGIYVRVIGNLRTVVKGRRSLVAFRLIRVEDFNEISYHHLECIYAHLYFLHGGVLAPLINKGAQSPVKPNIYSQSVSIKNTTDSPVKSSQYKSSQVPAKPSPLPKSNTQSTSTYSQSTSINSQPTFKTKAQPAKTQTVTSNPQEDGLSVLQKAIMQVIRLQGSNIDGIAIDTIVEEISHERGVDEDKIRRDIAWLLDVGHCFTTIDDDHIQAVDN